MSTLSAASTLAQVQAAYDDNASYAEDDSLAKARAFATACRLLLRRIPSRGAHGGRSGIEIEFDPNIVRGELTDAQRWIGTRSGGGGVKYLSVEDV
jgi:hypothetical protein